jgi:hypothetical protein
MVRLQGTASRILSAVSMVEPSASPIEAAAIVAALERFVRDGAHARTGSQAEHVTDPWIQAAVLEAVRDETGADGLDPWINT